MRVITGEFKGRRLAAPRWPGLRPTSDKLRETLFNVLAPAVPDARVLDGFAGTGALGIEALSRGAAHVTFVEQDPRAVALIAENLKRLGLTSRRYAIIRDRMRRAAERLAPHEFDLILLDPPYDDRDVEGTLAAAGERLAAAGWLVLERARRRETPDEAGRLRRVRTVSSGDSALDLYRRADMH